MLSTMLIDGIWTMVQTITYRNGRKIRRILNNRMEPVDIQVINP